MMINSGVNKWIIGIFDRYVDIVCECVIQLYKTVNNKIDRQTDTSSLERRNRIITLSFITHTLSHSHSVCVQWSLNNVRMVWGERVGLGKAHIKRGGGRHYRILGGVCTAETVLQFGRKWVEFSVPNVVNYQLRTAHTTFVMAKSARKMQH